VAEQSFAEVVANNLRVCISVAMSFLTRRGATRLEQVKYSFGIPRVDARSPQTDYAPFCCCTMRRASATSSSARRRSSSKPIGRINTQAALHAGVLSSGTQCRVPATSAVHPTPDILLHCANCRYGPYARANLRGLRPKCNSIGSWSCKGRALSLPSPACSMSSFPRVRHRTQFIRAASPMRRTVCVAWGVTEAVLNAD
jgi:hypothetical protein